MGRLLSICIPTYNRVEYLDATLQSIVGQPVFQETDDVEVVVSDNCSTDSTADLVETYVKQFPGKIIYHRTSRNIGFGNFCEVLSCASGEFLKLNNDTMRHNSGSLSIMLMILKVCRERKDLPFFTSGYVPQIKEDTFCTCIENVVKCVSFFTTWIVPFGLWREDFEYIRHVFEREQPSEIPQTHVLFELMSGKRRLLVSSDRIFDVQTPKKKGGYNVAEVFGNNYITLLRKYVATGDLSARTYRRELRTLCKFINHYYFDLKREFAFEKTGYLKWMLPFYWSKLYFYQRYIKMYVKDIFANDDRLGIHKTP